jgi:hypothetical protein
MNNPVQDIIDVEKMSQVYRSNHSRSPVNDLVIWQTLDMYYSDPEGHGLVALSTKEEAFERIVKDDWVVSYDFYGIDYETYDERVLDFLQKSGLVGDLED